MYVKEFMTAKLVTVTTDTPLARASRLLYAHRIRRLPVVDDDYTLVGILGERAVASALPSATIGSSSKDMAQSLSQLTAGIVMHPEVLTVTPDTTAEGAMSLAQDNKVGCLVVVDEQYKPVGIVTTNDVIYRILSPLLGLGKPGFRLHICDCGESGKISQITGLIEKHGMKLEVIHIDESPVTRKNDLIVQVVTKDPEPLISDLTKQGYKVELRKRKSWPIPEDD
ncbi:MAG: CBS domain-containing protein [Chloroflexi bacterium]|jgi:acetoin utilization protein AcuB|nr:CBS domain-containing protein [Chloroflexota bacterium]